MLMECALLYHVLSIVVSPPCVESLNAIKRKFKMEEVDLQTPNFVVRQLLFEGSSSFPTSCRSNHRIFRQEEGSWKELSEPKLPCNHVWLISNKRVTLLSWRYPCREDGRLEKFSPYDIRLCLFFRIGRWKTPTEPFRTISSTS